MKVELTTNLFHVINECAASIQRRCAESNVDEDLHCSLCPLCNACLEVLTGDDSENH